MVITLTANTTPQPPEGGAAKRYLITTIIVCAIVDKCIEKRPYLYLFGQSQKLS